MKINMKKRKKVNESKQEEKGSKKTSRITVAIRHAIVSILLINTCCLAAPSSGGQQNAVIQPASFYPLGHVQQRCPNGAPVQWRPYLDAASKAHLAPVVAVAALKHLNLTPIQLSVGGDSILTGPQQQQQPIAFHAQNVNNVGVNIEATFAILSVLKRGLPMSLNASQSIKLFYKVSASLSTTSALMTLANSQGGQDASGSRPSQAPASAHNQHLFRQLMQRQRAPCALELSEHELVRKAGKIFKLNRNYVLFLDQAPSQPMRGGGLARGQPDVVGPHPFATHELMTNQTSRALRKILCKNCGKFPANKTNKPSWPVPRRNGSFAGRPELIGHPKGQ